MPCKCIYFSYNLQDFLESPQILIRCLKELAEFLEDRNGLRRSRARGIVGWERVREWEVMGRLDDRRLVIGVALRSSRWNSSQFCMSDSRLASAREAVKRVAHYIWNYVRCVPVHLGL